MFPLSGYIQTALGFVNIALAVSDATLTTANGQDKQVLAGREIQAAVDPSGGKRLEQIFGGSVTDGDIGIYTSADLFIDDIYDDGERGKQSFVTYQGTEYKVVELSDWTIQAGVKVYRASRHVKQGQP